MRICMVNVYLLYCDDTVTEMTPIIGVLVLKKVRVLALQCGYVSSLFTLSVFSSYQEDQEPAVP